MTPWISPATRECWDAGISLSDIARRIGRSRPYVSQQLSGARALRADVLEAIRELAGDLVARRVAKAIKKSAAARRRAG